MDSNVISQYWINTKLPKILLCIGLIIFENQVLLLCMLLPDLFNNILSGDKEVYKNE